jgi:MiaB/RimO family radical SAM methylthiotransferase
MPQETKKFSTITLGCKINQYETQSLIEARELDGWVYQNEPADCQAIIINSCAVTARAVRDTRKAARQAAAANPEAEIIVTGCAVQAFEAEFSSMPEVSRAVLQKDKFTLSRESKNLDLRISDYFRARAPVRVQDGCSHRCTYCIVPLTRGKPISRSPEDCLQEIVRLFSAGIREISLCGINLSQYGRDLDPEIDFWELVNFLRDRVQKEWSGRARFRLSSLEPSELTPRALDTIKRCSDMLCPHLHISLQSGSPRILRKMNRGQYHPDQLFDFIRGLKAIWPVFGLGADILLGFPGEDRELYAQTRSVVDRLPLTYAHIFPFSPRPGTPAAKFSGQVDPGETKKRCRELKQITEEKKKAFHLRLLELPAVHPVLETRQSGMNEYFVPTELKNPLPSDWIRRIIPARTLDVKENKLTAEYKP